MLFKTYFKEENTQPPNEDIYYIIASNGIFIHKKVGFISAIVPVEGLPYLYPQKKSASLTLPKIPMDLTALSLNFFREVQKEFHAEAVVLIHYNKKKNTYTLDIPEQEVSHARVDYLSDNRFKDCFLVGSIHSHNNFDAFHSGVDSFDEKHFDGFHITIGDVDKYLPTISASIVINGSRFMSEPGQIMEGVQLVESKKTKKGFKKRKKFISYSSGYDLIKPKEDDKAFRLLLPEGKTLADYPVDLEWMEQVSQAKPTYQYYDKKGI